MEKELLEIIEKNTFCCSKVEDVPADEVNRAVEDASFACIRGLFQKEEMLAARAVMERNFSAEKDQPSQGEAPGAVMKNFQKLTIGGAGQHWVYNPRFMRVIYNPLWEADIYGFHAIFRRLARLRNHLMGKPPGYAIDTIDEGMWTASRLQHYPAGGGFIAPHKDAVISTVNLDSGTKKFHQLLLLVTTKGEDYEQGGAFVETDEEGKRIEFEEVLGAGDLAIYNGVSQHGVYDIDPHKLTDFTGLSGRMVAMASLYKDMSKSKKVYEGYEEKKTVEAIS